MLLADQVTTTFGFLFSEILVTPPWLFLPFPPGLSVDNSGNSLSIRTTCLVLLGDRRVLGRICLTPWLCLGKSNSEGTPLKKVCRGPSVGKWYRGFDP